MKSKLVLVCSTIMLFTSCELIQSSEPSPSTTEVFNKPLVCVWKDASEVKGCKIEYWLKFWFEVEDISWSQRKKQINLLSDQGPDIFRKVLLSQGKNTPYQARLRAQNWLESILPKLSQQMRDFIVVALYHPSQGLLEMESALVTLSKINTHQLANIEEQQLLLNKQQILLNKQQSQIDQLLNIEASIMQNIEEDRE